MSAAVSSAISTRTYPMAATSANPFGLRQLAALSPAERSRERYRRIVLGAGSAVAAKFLVAVCALVTIPLTLHYLGPERYGVLMVITSLPLMFRFADFGLGAGVTVVVAEASASRDSDTERRYVSTAFFVLCAIAAAWLLLLVFLYGSVDWAGLVKVSSRGAREVGPAFAVLFVWILIGLPTGVVGRVQTGQQLTMVSNAWSSVGTLAGTIALVAVVAIRGNLAWLVLVTVAVPVIAQAANWLTSGKLSQVCPRPRLSEFDPAAARHLTRLGVLMFLQQAFSLLTYAADPLIIARIAGPASVTTYVVVQKLFTFGFLAQFLTAPLWPAFAEAASRADHNWTRTALRRTLAITIGVQAALVLPVVLLGSALLRFWVGPAVAPTLALMTGFALWVLQAGYVSTMDSFLNYGATLRWNVLWLGAASIGGLVLRILFCRLWGSTGVVWGTVLAFSILYIPPTILLARGNCRG